MNTYSKPYEAFRHGLITSKIWLCEQLEQIIDNRKLSHPKLNILGCWDNVLTFMLLVRKPDFYGEINAYDLSDEAINAATEICDTWKFELPRVNHHLMDVNNIQFNDNDIVYINCSVDQFESTQWYDNIPIGSLVCMQSTDMPSNNDKWEITQSVSSLYELIDRYKMSTILFSGTHLVDYSTWSYNRFMIIGIK